MKLIALLAIACSAPVVSAATSILLPLYLYPSNNAKAWAPVFSAVAAHTTVQFNIIVNPDSGPGAGTYPDSNTIAGISQLNQYPNVQTIGYVHTKYTRTTPFSSYALLTANVTKYAKWSNYKPKDIHVDGIFFDEVLATNNAAAYTYMKNASAFARSTIPSPPSGKPVYIVFNPGELASNQTGTNYFLLADTIVQFENPFSTYKGLRTIQSIGGEATQSAILVYNTPAGTNLTTLVQQIVANDIGATYFTKGCCYQNLGLLGQLADDIAEA